MVGDKAFELCRKHEGCKLTAYKCPSGIWTIGYGHTRGVRPGMTCTQADADQWLAQDLAEAEAIVRHYTTVPISQNQLDSLSSFVLNVGPGQPNVKDGFVFLKHLGPNGERIHSTMLRKLNAGDYAGAAAEFPYWVHGAGGLRLPGLVTRRAEEMALFLT